jgi:hypothetical protein
MTRPADDGQWSAAQPASPKEITHALPAGCWEQAKKNGKAIGHFKISDLVLLKAIFASGRELKVPVLVGVSEGNQRFQPPRSSGPCALDGPVESERRNDRS